MKSKSQSHPGTCHVQFCTDSSVQRYFKRNLKLLFPRLLEFQDICDLFNKTSHSLKTMDRDYLEYQLHCLYKQLIFYFNSLYFFLINFILIIFLSDI